MFDPSVDLEAFVTPTYPNSSVRRWDIHVGLGLDWIGCALCFGFGLPLQHRGSSSFCGQARNHGKQYRSSPKKRYRKQPKTMPMHTHIIYIYTHHATTFSGVLSESHKFWQRVICAETLSSPPRNHDLRSMNHVCKCKEHHHSPYPCVWSERHHVAVMCAVATTFWSDALPQPVRRVWCRAAKQHACCTQCKLIPGKTHGHLCAVGQLHCQNRTCLHLHTWFMLRKPWVLGLRGWDGNFPCTCTQHTGSCYTSHGF